MIESVDAIQAIKAFGDAALTYLKISREIKDSFPDSDEKEQLEEQLIAAESAKETAEAQLAQALGYKLCQCTFPPQIMLSIGYKEINYSMREVFECPKCDKHDPYDGPIPKISIPDSKRI